MSWPTFQELWFRASSLHKPLRRQGFHVERVWDSKSLSLLWEGRREDREGEGKEGEERGKERGKRGMEEERNEERKEGRGEEGREGRGEERRINPPEAHSPLPSPFFPQSGLSFQSHHPFPIFHLIMNLMRSEPS